MDKDKLFPVVFDSRTSMFNQYLAKLNNITHENFAAIQQVQSDILNDYTAWRLSNLEKRTLYNATEIIMDNMRKQLKH